MSGNAVIGEENNMKKMRKRINRLVIENEELNLSKSKLEDDIKNQARAYYISSNFDKIDSESFKGMDFIAKRFDSDGYPQVNLKNFKVIKNQEQLDDVVNEVKTFKNYYKAGDIVTDNASFNIDKNNICYRADGKPMKLTKAFLKKYPQCMVCSTVNKKDLADSDSWEDTKTNIESVCLFNPDSKKDSGIPNLEGCKKMCNISTV